jgi:hypothetical protein
MLIIKKSDLEGTNQVQRTAHLALNVNAPTMDHVVWGLIGTTDVDSPTTSDETAQKEALYRSRQWIIADCLL